MFVVCCLLRVVCCVLLVACCPLLVADCLLSIDIVVGVCVVVSSNVLVMCCSSCVVGGTCRLSCCGC